MAKGRSRYWERNRRRAEREADRRWLSDYSEWNNMVVGKRASRTKLAPLSPAMREIRERYEWNNMVDGNWGWRASSRAQRQRTAAPPPPPSQRPPARPFQSRVKLATIRLRPR
jgi:hypothetical protein